MDYLLQNILGCMDPWRYMWLGCSPQRLLLIQYITMDIIGVTATTNININNSCLGCFVPFCVYFFIVLENEMVFWG